MRAKKKREKKNYKVLNGSGKGELTMKNEESLKYKSRKKVGKGIRAVHQCR